MEATFGGEKIDGERAREKGKENAESNITQLIRLLNYDENDPFRSNQKV